jgi:hypothetical protein
MTNPIEGNTPNKQQPTQTACPHQMVQVKGFNVQPNLETGKLMLVKHYWCLDCNTDYTVATEYEVEAED